MLRIVILVSVAAWLAKPNLLAGEPNKLLIVAADRQAAAYLPPISGGTKLTLLVEHEGESFEVVNLRALRLRHATHFIYDSDHEPVVSAIFRERLQNHGATIIDLKTYSDRRQLSDALFERSIVKSYANIREAY